MAMDDVAVPGEHNSSNHCTGAMEKEPVMEPTVVDATAVAAASLEPGRRPLVETTSPDDENGDNQAAGGSLSSSSSPSSSSRRVTKTPIRPGWKTVRDPDSGTIFYYNTETGETSWSPPPAPSPTRTVAEEEEHAVEPADASDAAIDVVVSETTTDTGEEDVGGMAPGTASPPIETLPRGWDKVHGETSWYPPLVAGAPTGSLADEEKEKAVGAADAVDVNAETTDADEGGDLVARTSETFDALPPGWEKVKDPDSGSIFFCNFETGETSWYPPLVAGVRTGSLADEEKEKAVGPATTAVRAAPDEDKDLAAVGSSEKIVALPPGWEQVNDPDSGSIFFCNFETGQTSWDPPPVAAKQPLSSRRRRARCKAF